MVRTFATALQAMRDTPNGPSSIHLLLGELRQQIDEALREMTLPQAYYQRISGIFANAHAAADDIHEAIMTNPPASWQPGEQAADANRRDDNDPHVAPRDESVVVKADDIDAGMKDKLNWTVPLRDKTSSTDVEDTEENPPTKQPFSYDDRSSLASTPQVGDTQAAAPQQAPNRGTTRRRPLPSE